MNLRNSLIALGVGGEHINMLANKMSFSKRNMKKARKMIKSYL
ncbi:DUF3918 family protein [Bacillus paranthracis]